MRCSAMLNSPTQPATIRKIFAEPFLSEIFLGVSELTIAECKAPAEGIEKRAMAQTRAKRLSR